MLVDCGESCRMPYEAIVNRWETAPRIIFYDNGCHLHAYAMHRNPVYFFRTTFFIDRLHIFNHIKTCSCLYNCDNFNHWPSVGNAVTTANEQFFKNYRERLGISIAAMIPENALIVSAVYCQQHNNRYKYNTAKRNESLKTNLIFI